MNSIVLADRASVLDMRSYLGRARQIMDESVRVYAAGPVLALYVPVKYPSALMDTSVTVLGLRTFALAENCELDEIFTLAALSDRLAHLLAQSDSASLDDRPETMSLPLPHSVPSVTWAGISPPRGGWQQKGQLTAEEFTLVTKRHELLPNLAPEAVLGVDKLGFLQDKVYCFTAPGWFRLTSGGGHILVRSRRS